MMIKSGSIDTGKMVWAIDAADRSSVNIKRRIRNFRDFILEESAVGPGCYTVRYKPSKLAGVGLTYKVFTRKPRKRRNPFVNKTYYNLPRNRSEQFAWARYYSKNPTKS